MSGPNQRNVFRLLQNASHPMSVAEASQALNLPEPTVRVAIRALHESDLVLPANNRRRGQVWMADKAASMPEDKRGRVVRSLVNLRRGRGFVGVF